VFNKNRGYFYYKDVLGGGAQQKNFRRFLSILSKTRSIS